MMEQFRNQPPHVIAGQKVIKVLDYKTSTERSLLNGQTKIIPLPKSDVLQFLTWEGSKISVRPSGTEPKIKFYISVSLRLSDPKNFELAVLHQPGATALTRMPNSARATASTDVRPRTPLFDTV